MALPEPDVNIWVSRYKVVADQQRSWRTLCAHIEQLYEGTWQIEGIPSGIEITIPSTARAIIDEATDHSDFNPDWLKIHLPTYGLATEAESRSSRLRSFLIGWLGYQAEHANDVSPFRDWIKNIYLHGKGVYKVVPDYTDWPELQIPEGTTEDEARQIRADLSAEREFANIPATLRSIYPLAIFEDPSIGEKRWAIECYEADAIEIMPLYEKWQPKKRKDNGETYTREEFEIENSRLAVWDCYQTGEVAGHKGVWHQVLINEMPVASENTFGGDNGSYVSPAQGPEARPVFLKDEPFPYVIKFSGLGRQSAGKYEEKARGILTAVTSLLKAEARRLTQLDAIVAQAAWPTLFVTGNRARFEVAFGPNVVNYVPIGTSVTPVTPNIPAAAVQAALATIQSGIERGTFGSVIRGDKPPNTTSAAQLAILSGQARLRFGAINNQHQAALSDISQKVAHIVKKVIAEPVAIWQTDDVDEESSSKLVIKPGEIPERLIVRYLITTDPAEARDREISLAALMYEKGIIDLEEMRERAGIRNTAAMRRRVIRDKVLMESPGVLAALGEQFMLESGYDIESLTLEKAMRDMLIIRRQTQMQQELFGGPTGGANANGSQPASMSPTPLGGAPNGVPTPGMAEQQGQNAQSAAFFGPVIPGQGGSGVQVRGSI
jgi:hypothetical protein